MNIPKIGSKFFTKPTGGKHTATIIFFHGSGGCGADMQEWVKILCKEFSFPHIKVIYPTAYYQYYTVEKQWSNVWFDRVSIRPEAPEMLDSLKIMEGLVKRLIKAENEAGIPTYRILVGGFSMGGALALYTAYKWIPGMAGVFVFSSFLNKDSIVYPAVKNRSRSKLPPLYQFHGNRDEVVAVEWGRGTFKRLRRLGVKGEFFIMERLTHTLTSREITLLKDWIEKRLPNI